MAVTLDHEGQFREDAARCLTEHQNHRGELVVEFLTAPFVRVYLHDGGWWTIDFLGRRLRHCSRELAVTYADLLPADWLRLIREHGS